MAPKTVTFEKIPVTYVQFYTKQILFDAILTLPQQKRISLTCNALLNKNTTNGLISVNHQGYKCACNELK